MIMTIHVLVRWNSDTISNSLPAQWTLHTTKMGSEAEESDGQATTLTHKNYDH